MVWERRRLERLNRVTASAVSLNPFLYTNRTAWHLWLTRVQLVEEALRVPGSIVECGVRDGAGVMLYSHCIDIFDPLGIDRKVIGFDTFAGFPSVGHHDPATTNVGDVASTISYEELSDWALFAEENRVISTGRRVEFVRGDAITSIPTFVASRPELVIAMLVLDFDLYEPTKVALEHLLPRVPLGGIVVLDEAASQKWPGETVALNEVLGIANIRLRRHATDAHTSSFVVEPT